jgi:hypothetical protein
MSPRISLKDLVVRASSWNAIGTLVDLEDLSLGVTPEVVVAAAETLQWNSIVFTINDGGGTLAERDCHSSRLSSRGMFVGSSVIAGIMALTTGGNGERESEAALDRGAVVPSERGAARTGLFWSGQGFGLLAEGSVFRPGKFGLCTMFSFGFDVLIGPVADGRGASMP